MTRTEAHRQEDQQGNGDFLCRSFSSDPRGLHSILVVSKEAGLNAG